MQIHAVTCSRNLIDTLFTSTAAKEAEVEWLQTLMAASLKEQLDEIDWMSWFAYHSSIQEAIVPPSAINTLLPLFWTMHTP